MRAARRIAAWLLVAPVVVWAIGRLLGLERGFPLIPLTAFTPYAAAAAVVAALLAVALRRPAPAAVGALAAVALVAVVVPRAVGGGGAPRAAGPPLRVLSANVLIGAGSAEALVALARRERADVLSVQELTPAFARRLDAAGARDLFPHRVLEPRPRTEGTGLYGRMPLRARPPVRAGFVMASATGPGFEIVAVHPIPPLRPGTVGFWHRGLRALPPAPRKGPARILAGDFNATLDHAELRRLLSTGYVDAADAAGAGLVPTWPSGTRRRPPLTIDHVFADERVGVRRVSVHDLPGSDHRAVLAELTLP